MGTRNLTAVVLNGEYKIAQYGQWDGYPSGQGATAVKFLRSERNRNKLKKALKKCRWVTQAELDAATEKLGFKSEWLTMEESRLWDAEFPYLNRDHGAEILEVVSTSPDKDIPLRNSLEFAADSLFCEWGYVVDFDKNTFEVYRGFSTKPLSRKERFATVQGEPVIGMRSKKEYHPIRHVKTYKLGRLPKPANLAKAINKLVKE